jgi:predicted ATPase/transcriptional regulator with XRE-family HTH domain
MRNMQIDSRIHYRKCGQGGGVLTSSKQTGARQSGDVDPVTSLNATSVKFGDLLRSYRLAAGLTQEGLADRARVSPRAISDLERGARQHPWRETVRLLADALGLEPSERSRLEAAARVAGATSVAAGPAAFDDASVVRHNLPVPLSSFVGRQREMAAVRQLLATTRLLTLTGPGGSGKTRLALEIARNVAEAFPDSVIFVALAATTAPTLVIPAIAQALGVKESAGHPLVQDLAEALRGQRALLVLDNFEHVADAAGNIAVLLEACPELKTLVTSRSSLHLRGEREFFVPPLSVPDRDAAAHPGRILESDAVRLFAERACAVRPDFVVTDQNAATVAEVCRRLDGLPLAIELAAAKTRTLTPAEILDRLGTRLRLLTGGARDLPARQQTLRNTIAWSYQLLSEAERVLFRRLAVFAGGCTLESAAVVGGEATIGDAEGEFATLDLLDGLVDENLIQRDGSGGDTTRFTMLETIREYAGEMLVESGEASGVARAHAAYFFARVVGEQTRPTTENMRVSEVWLERERPNLLAALRWFRDEGEAADGLRLVAATWALWYDRGPHREGREWLTTFLRLTAGGPRDLARASALLAAGLSAIASGDPAAARADLEEGLAIGRELEDAAAEADFLEALGMMETELGNLAAARPHLDAALGYERVVANRVNLTSVLVHRGDLAAAEGDDTLARSLYEESLAVGGMPEWSLRMLAYVALRDGDVSTARALLRDSLKRYRRLAYVIPQVECLSAFAGVALAEGNAVKAGRLLGAVGALLRTAIEGGFHLRDRWEHERFLAAAREKLGEDAFAAAFADGRAMTLDSAVALALEEGDD